SFRDEFVYVDGFSGPWKSEDEALEDTSFMIALNQLRKVRQGLKERGRDVRMRCFFNDNDELAYKNLEKTVADVEDIEIKALCRDLEDVVPEIVDYVGGSFSLIFIDPTGWGGFGLQKIESLLALPGEIIINFMFDYVNRFLDDPTPEIAAKFDSLFGGPAWHLDVERQLKAGHSREDAILDVYRERLRKFGKFPHVTSTRILKPLAERSYFHLVYGTRHWKGLVEYRNVEKKSVDEQERVRGVAKRTYRIERTGQDELFGQAGEQLGPRSSDEERKKQLGTAYTKLREILATRRSCKYETLIGEILEMPFVWESDLKNWLRDARKAGEIEIPELKGRQRTPKPGHSIIWKAH
ncbi:MAG: three-Cys-motif partner protein TcmP, partial [Alphaproteobacteria bacterium]